MYIEKITYGELPDLGDSGGLFLWCPTCNARYSANRGDYFMRPPYLPVKCNNGHTARNMALARERTTVEIVGKQTWRP